MSFLWEITFHLRIKININLIILLYNKLINPALNFYCLFPLQPQTLLAIVIYIGMT